MTKYAKTVQMEKLKKVADKEAKDQAIVGIGDIDKLIAQKTKGFSDIYYARAVDIKRPRDKTRMVPLPKQCFAIATIYLGKIDSHNDSKQYVFISLQELKKALNRKSGKFTEEELSTWMAHLQAPCRILSWNKDELVNICDHSRIVRDDNKQAVGIMLACSEVARKYIFNLEENDMRYVKIMVSCVLNFSSRFSFVFFDNIVARYYDAHGYDAGFDVKWSIELDELKALLDCPANYDWRSVRERAIKHCIEDVNSFTPYKVDYSVDNKNKVKRVEFTISLSEKIYQKTENTTDEDDKKYPYYDDFETYEEYCEYKEGLSNSERKEMEAINQIKNENLGVGWILNVLRNSLDEEIYSMSQLSYLARCCKRFLEQHETLDIPDSSLVYKYTINDLVDRILGFEDKARDEVKNKDIKFVYGKYVIACFENWTDAG